MSVSLTSFPGRYAVMEVVVRSAVVVVRSAVGAVVRSAGWLGRLAGRSTCIQGTAGQTRQGNPHQSRVVGGYLHINRQKHIASIHDTLTCIL